MNICEPDLIEPISCCWLYNSQSKWEKVEVILTACLLGRECWLIGWNISSNIGRNTAELCTDIHPWDKFWLDVTLQSDAIWKEKLDCQATQQQHKHDSSCSMHCQTHYCLSSTVTHRKESSRCANAKFGQKVINEWHIVGWRVTISVD